MIWLIYDCIGQEDTFLLENLLLVNEIKIENKDTCSDIFDASSFLY